MRTATSDPNQVGVALASDLTQQTDLINLTIKRDRVGNPTTISDAASSTWPAGAQPVNQTFSYGNDYRLTLATPPVAFRLSPAIELTRS